MDFGLNLKEIRKASGLTQKQVAERLGVTPQAVCKWERNVTEPDMATVSPRKSRTLSDRPRLTSRKSKKARKYARSAYSRAFSHFIEKYSRYVYAFQHTSRIHGLLPLRCRL